MMKLNMNEKRVAVLDVLKNTNEPITLAQIAEKAGMPINSGTTNAMITAGLIKKVGTTKVEKVTYVEVTTYALGDVTLEDLQKAIDAENAAKAKAKAEANK